MENYLCMTELNCTFQECENSLKQKSDLIEQMEGKSGDMTGTVLKLETQYVPDASKTKSCSILDSVSVDKCSSLTAGRRSSCQQECVFLMTDFGESVVTDANDANVNHITGVDLLCDLKQKTYVEKACLSVFLSSNEATASDLVEDAQFESNSCLEAEIDAYDKEFPVVNTTDSGDSGIKVVSHLIDSADSGDKNSNIETVVPIDTVKEAEASKEE